MNYKIVNASISYGADTILEEINFEENFVALKLWNLMEWFRLMATLEQIPAILINYKIVYPWRLRLEME